MIRDHLGAVIVAMSKKLHVPLWPLEVEAKAMEEVIAFAWYMVIRDAIFKGDSQVVVNALMGNSVLPFQIANNISGSLSQIQ